MPARPLHRCRRTGVPVLALAVCFLLGVSADAGAQTVVSLTLINADDDTALFSLVDGMTIDRSTLPTIAWNVRADTSPSPTGSVRFDLDGVMGYRVESAAPYALEGDSGGDYAAWIPSLGAHTITATAYAQSGASGTPGGSITISFTVEDSSAPPPGTGGRVMVFFETGGFTHSNQIVAGVSMLESIAVTEGLALDIASDSNGFFTPTALADYGAVVFLNTTGDILDAAEQAAFEAWVAAGGGYLGIHSATDTEYNWPFYGQLVGAWFQNHPPGTTPATLTTVDPTHPSTDHLGATFSWTDEWYNFQTNPADDPTIDVLITIDESTYTGGTMGNPHPITWCRDPASGGRSWYTAMGHNTSAYSEPFFVEHVREGLVWVIDAPPVADDPFLRGDANGDGGVDISDAVTLLANLFEGTTPIDCNDARDANDDGAIDISDPVRVLGVLFGTDGPLPAPAATCGADPTADTLSCSGPCP